MRRNNKMSSFLDLTDENLEDAIEPKAAPDGEYTIKLADWKTTDDGNVQKEDTNGNPYIMPVLEIIECPEAEYAKPFSHFLRLPHDGMSKKDRNAASFHLRCFWEAFGVNYLERIIYEDCLGLTADALLSIQPDTGYGEQNRIQKLLVPK